MGKKKGNNNNNTKQDKHEEVVEAVADAVIDSLKEDKQADNSATTDSYGETPSHTPTAPPTETARVAKAPVADDNTSSSPAPIEREKYTIVPTPVEETAIQRVSGYYRRMDNNERTEKEAAQEEEHFARLETLKGQEREIAERAWSYKPAHLLLEVAFLNNEKFTRQYLEAQQEAFLFMAATDLQRERSSIQEVQRILRSKTDAINREEFDVRSNIRKEAREEFNSLMSDRDTSHRAVLAADREAKRKARNEALPAPPQGLDSQNDYDSASQQAGSE